LQGAKITTTERHLMNVNEPLSKISSHDGKRGEKKVSDTNFSLAWSSRWFAEKKSLRMIKEKQEAATAEKNGKKSGILRGKNG
jgi:hypothetical protein